MTNEHLNAELRHVGQEAIAWLRAARADPLNVGRIPVSHDMIDALLCYADAFVAREPQPMDTAPPGDGWILGLVEGDGAWGAKDQPWAILSRCDGGWMDDGGNGRTPTAWMPLPDPQPKPTGWAPVEGTIRMEEITGEGWTSNGKPVEVDWRWLIYIERLDGSYDEYRDTDFAVTQDEAERRAIKLQEKHGLPIVIIPLKSETPNNVILLHPASTRQ